MYIFLSPNNKDKFKNQFRFNEFDVWEMEDTCAFIMSILLNRKHLSITMY